MARKRGLNRRAQIAHNFRNGHYDQKTKSRRGRVGINGVTLSISPAALRRNKDGADLIIDALQSWSGEDWEEGPEAGMFRSWGMLITVPPRVMNWMVRRDYKEVRPIRFKIREVL